jgi:hypothetical protein
MPEATKNRRKELGSQLTHFCQRERLQIAMLTIVLAAFELDLGKLSKKKEYTKGQGHQIAKAQRQERREQVEHKQPQN